jgi:hypothetical protein
MAYDRMCCLIDTDTGELLMQNYEANSSLLAFWSERTLLVCARLEGVAKKCLVTKVCCFKLSFTL